MKVTKFPKKLNRKYLRLASAYRRFAGRSEHFDFSLTALQECYDKETYGTPASKNNGYLYGKWCKDISVATWIEDIVKGDFCKAEFYTPCNKWWTIPALENVIVPAWFTYEECASVKIDFSVKRAKHHLNFAIEQCVSRHKTEMAAQFDRIRHMTGLET